MLALTIPLLLALLVILAIICLIRKKWKAASLLLVVTFALNWWSDCFCFGFKHNYEGHFKVLSINVNGSGGYNESKANSILELIKVENPDILFLTESFCPLGDSLYSRLQKGYLFSTRVLRHNEIYSKFPISNIKYFERLNDGTSYIIQCEVKINNHIAKIVGSHLSSNNYSYDLNYLTPSDVGEFPDVIKYVDNIKNASRLRELEAQTIANEIKGNKYSIVMGDLNDVSGSPALRTLENIGMKDAWCEGGFGYGATIHNPFPFRIDHVLFGTGFKLKGIKIVDTCFCSDHDALVAVFDFVD